MNVFYKKFICIATHYHEEQTERWLLLSKKYVLVS